MPLPAPSAHYKFDGLTIDSSGNGHDITTAASYRYVGKFGNALGSGAGGSPFVSQPIDPLTCNSVTGPYSISYWGEIRTGLGNTFKIRDTGGSFDVLSIDLTPSGVTAILNDATNQYALSGGGTLAKGFHHIAFTVDAGVATLYVDGVAVDSQSVSGGVTFGSVAYTWLCNNRGFDDFVIVDGAALSASDVSGLWNDGTGTQYA